VLDNAVFGAFSRGVYKISDSNVELLSLPIQNLIESALVGDLNSDATSYGFAVADNPDHKYILWLPTNTDINDYSDIAFVYDTFTNEWTTWDMKARHALSYKDTSLYTAFETECYSRLTTSHVALGKYASILQENKNLNANDFFDDIAWAIPSIDTSPDMILRDYDNVNHTIRLGTGDNITGLPGTKLGLWDIIVPKGELPDYEQAIMVQNVGQSFGDPGTIVPIMNKIVPWLTPGAQTTPVTVYRGIPHSWKFVQAFPESPAATNHFSELVVSFREAFFSQLFATFQLPREQGDPGHDEPQIVAFDGLHHFGPLRQSSKSNFIRTYVPRQSQRGTTLTAGIITGVCGVWFESNGITMLLTQGPASFQRR